MRKLTVALWVMVGGLLLLLGLTVGDFVRRTQPTFLSSSAPLPGVVFTGQFSRVHAGLALLEKGELDTLLISGVNPGAGITVTGFADQFELPPSLQQALAKGALMLGPVANTTLENAQEASHWLSALAPDKPVVLVTTQFHMPRASLALEQAIGQRLVLRYVVSEDPTHFEAVLVEFWKYVGTRCGLTNRQDFAARMAWLR